MLFGWTVMGVIVMVLAAACTQPSADRNVTTLGSSLLEGNTDESRTTTTATAQASSTSQPEQSAPDSRTEGVAPITGYGDFSDRPAFEVDWYRVSELVVERMNDQGFPAALIPPGDGISVAEIPPEQRSAAEEVFDACYAGLNLPPQQPLDDEQIAEVYAYRLAVADCLRAEGYQVPPAPSLDTFIEEWATGPWNPYESVDTSGASWEGIQMRCPQSPAGGYGAWDPGDPIRPLNPPREQ
ncbi:MAG: hypothetical protein KatS3mg011_0725 [Acidimicrobiia bacterium]|nr:MAG: hypothetical protein KatS3mg011_0725 [Acidimicrobiia bacterium]